MICVTGYSSSIGDFKTHSHSYILLPTKPHLLMISPPMNLHYIQATTMYKLTTKSMDNIKGISQNDRDGYFKELWEDSLPVLFWLFLFSSSSDHVLSWSFFSSVIYGIFPLQALPCLLSSMNTHCVLSPLHSLHYLTTPRVNMTSHLLLKSHIFSCNEPHKQPYPFCGKRIFHICLTVQWLTWIWQKNKSALI